jgi:hypothetical protein
VVCNSSNELADDSDHITKKGVLIVLLHETESVSKWTWEDPPPMFQLSHLVQSKIYDKYNGLFTNSVYVHSVREASVDLSSENNQTAVHVSRTMVANTSNGDFELLVPRTVFYNAVRSQLVRA